MQTLVLIISQYNYKLYSEGNKKSKQIILNDKKNSAQS
jgi:hypothetical protein